MTTAATRGIGAETHEQRSQTLRGVVWATMIAATIALILQMMEDPATIPRRTVSLAFTNSFGLLALWLDRRGRTGLGGGTFIAALIVVITWRGWTLGGLDAPVTAGYVVMVVMSGVLLGRRSGLLMGALTAALMAFLIAAKVQGWLPRAELRFSPLGLWLSNCIWLVLAFSLQGQIGVSLREALGHTARELEQRKLAEQRLRERVKELNVLHAAATLLQRSHATALESFQELVALIPGAWQHQDVCAARITFGDYVAATPNWRLTEWRMAKSFATEEGAGTIEVVYLEPRSAAHEGPFLAEERAVLDSLAEMLTAYVELRRQRHVLEQLVADRTRELSIARDIADRASRAKSTFLAHISHEIRTPLNAVLGHAQLLDEDTSLPDARRRNVGAILTSGSHLLTMINDVLEASKMEAGRTELAPQPMDLHATLTDVEHMFAELARAKALDLNFERDVSVPRTLHADASKIRQVLINLIGNALKFTDRGTVHVQTTAEQLTDHSAGITIAVTDTGRGINAEDQPRIFSAFEQAASGKHAGGTGLGLTISRSFARMMRGDVTLQSEPGDGSTFSFTFIAERSGPNALSAPDLERTPPTQTPPPARPKPSPSTALAALLIKLPAPLLAELRAAAIQARTTRLEQLANDLASSAPDAADAIATLVRDFRYDDLVTAIDGIGFQSTP